MKHLIVEIKVCDEVTGLVEQHFVETYGDNLGYEVERMFDRLGRRFARVMDPYMESE